MKRAGLNSTGKATPQLSRSGVKPGLGVLFSPDDGECQIQQGDGHCEVI